LTFKPILPYIRSWEKVVNRGHTYLSFFTKMLPSSEQFAFYINAYNAWTIKLILSAYPGVKSIKDLESFFKENPY